MDGTSPAQSRRAGWRLMTRKSRLMLCIAVAAIVAIGVIIGLSSSGEAKTPSARTARSFTLAELAHPGTKLSLASLAGKPVIINFFASWCAPCRRETPMLASFYRSHHGKVLVVGVDSNDESGPAMRFVRAEGVGYPVVVDPFPSSVTVSYGVLALPQTFFLNARHQIVRHVEGALTMRELTSWAASLSGHAPG